MYHITLALLFADEHVEFYIVVGFSGTPARSPATGCSWSTPVHWYSASLAVSYWVSYAFRDDRQREIATKRWLFIEFYDYTTFFTVLATSTERCAHRFCVFCPRALSLDAVPTYLPWRSCTATAHPFFPSTIPRSIWEMSTWCPTLVATDFVLTNPLPHNHDLNIQRHFPSLHYRCDRLVSSNL
jgi:hypothetical protein